MTTLFLNDKLNDPKMRRIAMVVTGAQLVVGKVRVLEAGANTERMVPYEDIRQKLSNGELELRHGGCSEVTRLAI